VATRAGVRVEAPDPCNPGPEVRHEGSAGQTFELSYLPAKPAASGGIHTFMRWSDPGEPNGKPKRITKIQFRFHPGTRIDTRALRQCRASDVDVRIQGVRAGPKASRLGFATSRVITASTPADRTNIRFFNAPRQIIVLVRVEDRTLAVYRDDIKGHVVTVNPDLPAGRGVDDHRGLHLHRRLEPAARRRISVSAEVSV